MLRRTLLVGNDTDESGEGGLQVFGLEDHEVIPGPVHELVSPTYLVLHPTRPLVLAVSSDEDSQVHSFRLDDGAFPASLAHISSAPVGRRLACHLAVSPDGNHVLVACYNSGSVTSHRIDDDGSLTPPVDTVDFTGSGPNADRQEAAHAHQVVFDGDVALVPDLGSDRVHRLRLGTDGALTALDPISMPAGMGPRHLVLHEDRLIVIGELDGHLWVGRREGDGFGELGRIRASVNDETQASALRIAGGKLYASLRGADTVAEFDLDGDLPQWRREFPVGRCPRDFVVDGTSMWVTHQEGSAVARYDLTDDVPEPGETHASLSPAVLLVVPAAG